MGRFLKLSAPEEPMDEDPLAGVANLFDASIVFIVGLMVTLFSVYNMGDLMNGQSEVTLVKTDASGLQEVIVKKGEKITTFKLSQAEGQGNGERLGAAYRLANGQIIYVPDRDDTQAEGRAKDVEAVANP